MNKRGNHCGFASDVISSPFESMKSFEVSVSRCLWSLSDFNEVSWSSSKSLAISRTPLKWCEVTKVPRSLLQSDEIVEVPGSLITSLELVWSPPTSLKSPGIYLSPSNSFEAFRILSNSLNSLKSASLLFPLDQFTFYTCEKRNTVYLLRNQCSASHFEYLDDLSVMNVAKYPKHVHNNPAPSCNQSCFYKPIRCCSMK